MRSDVEVFRKNLDLQTLETVDAIRSIISAAHSGLQESIKWNAPSFALGGDDRITLGLERRGGVRVVLHRGAKTKDSAGFSFDDKTGLARWPTPDRGIMVFSNIAEVEQHAAALSELSSRWLAATS